MHELRTLLLPSETTMKRYRRCFSIDEIERSTTLQWSFGAILFFFFLTFSRWDNDPSITVEAAQRGGSLCWPYFQECGRLFFLHGLPNGYTETTSSMLLYGIMLLIVYAIWRERWDAAHALMLPLLLWKVFVGFVLSYTLFGPYDYYHLIFTVIILFLPLKEYFLRFALVFCYFLSATIKFDGTWELGTYFSAMSNGLPYLPNALVPLITSFVIFMQVIGAWFLLSKRVSLQRLVLSYCIFFHLYSGILVGYTYPSITLPLLIILFGPLYVYQAPPRSRASIAGWVFMAILLALQLAPFAIEGDRRLTLEGNRIGMFMFEANHECRATITTYERTNEHVASSTTALSPGTYCGSTMCTVMTSVHGEKGLQITEQRIESGSAWNRCDPYIFWEQYHGKCADRLNIEKISFVFDHSINGGPFYRIVDLDNVCDVQYKAFGHNDWIHLPPEAPVVGYPLQDDYRY